MIARIRQFWFVRLAVFMLTLWLIVVPFRVIFYGLTWEGVKHLTLVIALMYLCMCIAAYALIGLWRLMKFFSYRELLKPDSIRSAAFDKWKTRKE